MDSLIITGLNIDTVIGVHAWEQKIKQKVLLDISIPSDFSNCLDFLANTLDYDALCSSITEFVEGKNFQLIETLANEVCRHVKESFKVAKLTVTVTKPHAVKNAGAIQVRVER